MVVKIRIILDLLLSPYTYCVGSLTPTKRLSYPSYHTAGWRDCLPLFAEHIGGVAQRDEGVDTVYLTPPSLRDTSPINSAKAP